jgi:arylsulfatase A-like enzyme
VFAGGYLGSKKTPSGSPGSAEESGIKNIVLITLDTVRADHLGFMGYPRNTTPFLDKLAKQGIVFKNAFSTSPETTPSHYSLFTSLYPFEHHVMTNSTELTGFRTLAEYLQEETYVTGGFVSVLHLKSFNKGFDYFDFDGVSDDQKPQPANESWRKTADITIGKAKEWFDKNSSKGKKFLWVHLYDAHYPYADSINYQESDNDSLKGDALIHFWKEKQGINPDFILKDKNEEKVLNLLNKYDGELQFMDSQIEDLFNFLARKGYGRDTLWIITSDHGEGLSSHSYYDHSEKVYNEQLRAPIVFYGSEIKNGKTIDGLVENVDILPTVAELVGFNINGRISGKSLVPFMSNSNNADKNYVFGMGQFGLPFNLPSPPLPLPNANPTIRMLWGQLLSLQDAKYKYIYSPDTKGKDELFDLEKDPNELNNLMNDPRVRFAGDSMKNKIIDMLRGKIDFNYSDSSSEDEKLKEALKALGY